MKTNDKTRTGGRRARPGTDGHGFRHDINSARGAFLSRWFFRESSIPGFSLRFERHRRFFAAARRSSLFAVLSQKAPKNVKTDSTHIDERNPSQAIENNQSRYALLDTLVSARAARNREGKSKEDPTRRVIFHGKCAIAAGLAGRAILFDLFPLGGLLCPERSNAGGEP
jgi:hypothetical protein